MFFGDLSNDLICVFEVILFLNGYICVFQVAICICAGLDGQNALSGDSSSDCSKGRGRVALPANTILAHHKIFRIDNNCLETTSTTKIMNIPTTAKNNKRQNTSDRQQLFGNFNVQKVFNPFKL